MAQTNFTPILLYASSTATNVPSAGNLTNSATGSEIAINIADKNLFFKDSGGSVNTVPIRQSSTSSNGWLSSTDWNTFNNKSNTNGTVTSVAALTIGTTGTDLSSTVANGTTTPVITLQVPTASATNRGALSSTDWSTFNGKQAALVSGTNIKTVSGVSLLGSGDLGTIGSTYGGTGQSTYAIGDLLQGGATNTLTKLSAVATGNALISGGVTTASSWGKIGLTTHVSGTLPIANGGTNLTSFTSGGVLYASSTSALATSSNLTFDGTNLSTAGSVTAANTFATSAYIGINAVTATTIATGISFLAVIRDRGNGEAALILYENNVTPVIVSQTGSKFVTGSPGLTQIQIANLSGGAGITAKSGATIGNTNINISILKNQ